MHRARSLLEDGKHHRRQRSQRGSLDGLEEFAHLLAGRPVDARVGHVLLPIGEEKILRRQTLEGTSLDRIVLRILHPGLHFALVPRHGRLGRQNRRAVMPGEFLQLGIEFRVKPAGLNHARLQVVDHHRGRHAAPMPERILQTPDETLARLPPHRLAVALARMTQHSAEQMRPAPLPVLDHPGALAKIHLQLLSGLALHPAEGQLRRRAVVAQYKPAHRVITSRKLMLHHQILINPLHRQPCLEGLLDLRAPRITQTGRTQIGDRAGLRAGG